MLLYLCSALTLLSTDIVAKLDVLLIDSLATYTNLSSLLLAFSVKAVTTFSRLPAGNVACLAQFSL